MTSHPTGIIRTLGTLRADGDRGVVHLEVRLPTNIDNLWSALTDPQRLAQWLGEVKGDLRQGGEFRARYFASGWEGTVRVEACVPLQRMLLLTSSTEEPDGEIDVTLTADRDHTTLIIEDRGLPLQQIAAYGAGDQIHLEDLASYLAGGKPCDARVRWAEFHFVYQSRPPISPKAMGR